MIIFVATHFKILSRAHCRCYTHLKFDNFEASFGQQFETPLVRYLQHLDAILVVEEIGRIRSGLESSESG